MSDRTMRRKTSGRGPISHWTLLLTVLLVSGAPSLASVPAKDWYVDGSAPGCTHGTGTRVNPFCKINRALKLAKSGDRIHIAKGTYYESLYVDKDISLIGESGRVSVPQGDPRTIVDGDGKDRVLEIATGAVVSLRDLRITNGDSGDGGGIFVQSQAAATMTHCLVDSCYAYNPSYAGDAYGGGIYNLGSLEIVASTIRDNDAYSGSGYSYGGGIASLGRLTLVDSTVSGNGNPGGEYGGGIFIIGDARILRSRFIANGAAQGGGVYIGSASVTIQDSRFHGNRVKHGGGGINVYSALPVAITGCIVTGNESYSRSYWGRGGGIHVAGGVETHIEGCTVAGNFSSSQGGGINGDMAMILDCVVAGNETVDGRSPAIGAGVSIWGPFPTPGRSRLSGTVIAGNTSDRYGGGLAVDQNASAFVSECTIAGNNALRGGGMRIMYGSLGASIDHVVLAGNTAQTHPDGSGTVTSNGFNCIGDTSGAILVGDPTGNLLDVDPRFLPTSSGTWTQDEQLDRVTQQVVMTDASASWAPGILVGSFVNPDANQGLQFPIVANGSTTLTMWADYRTLNPGASGPWALSGKTYVIHDYTVQPGSPVVDAGDSSLAPAGSDLAGNPRLLDGILDQRMVVDMGVYEFNHLRLLVDCDSSPGGTLSATLLGPASFRGWLWVGREPGETLLPPFGSLFLNLSSRWALLPVGALPATLSTPTLPGADPRCHWILQGIGIDPATGAGNLSNVVQLLPD